MFNPGDIVLNLRFNTLSVALNPFWGIRFAETDGSLSNSVQLMRKYNANHVLAKQIEIDSIMKGRQYPSWVLDIQKGTHPVLKKVPLNNLPLKKRDVPHGWIDPTKIKPEPPKTDYSGVMTLATLQTACKHVWAPYRGFRFDDEFCIHCTLKRSVK